MQNISSYTFFVLKLRSTNQQHICISVIFLFYTFFLILTKFLHCKIVVRILAFLKPCQRNTIIIEGICIMISFCSYSDYWSLFCCWLNRLLNYNYTGFLVISYFLCLLITEPQTIRNTNQTFLLNWKLYCI